MKKVVTAEEMVAVEQRAYSAGAQEEAFMEEAGRGVAVAVSERYSPIHPIVLLCGKGNNSGDAYVAGRFLLEEGYSVVAYQYGDIGSSSVLCQLNHGRFFETGGQLLDELSFPDEGVIVDGLLGTGYHGSLRGEFPSLIAQANTSGLPIVAIDIPSGVNATTGEVVDIAIQATYTVALGLPKQGYFFQEGWEHLGDVIYHNFGLQEGDVASVESAYLLLEEEDVREKLPLLHRTRHKFQAGYVVGVAGSPTMPGAAALAGFAALRSGAGIVRLCVPEGTETPLEPYELIKEPFSWENVSQLAEIFARASSCFLGPGLGVDRHCDQALIDLLSFVQIPSVLDADALNHFALLEGASFPKGAILTPHLGEMHRLLANDTKDPVLPEFLRLVQDYAEKHHVIIVLKGSPTFIIAPGKQPLISAVGDPGMATAGSGDVLTGVIAALLAQGVEPYDAAQLGAYLHGCAGRFAAEQLSSYSMVARDIIEYLPEAFVYLVEGVL